MAPEAASRLFDRLDRDLWVVTAQSGSHRGGLVATFVGPASIVPDLPRVLVGIARHHQTWSLVEASRAFALHLLGEEQLNWLERFGLRSARDVDKFAGLDVGPGLTGSPVLAHACAWLDCRVEASLDAGDRTFYLAAVVDAFARDDLAPLTTHRLLDRVSEPVRQEMLEQLRRDIARDAEAIRAWRVRSGVEDEVRGPSGESLRGVR